MAGDAPEAGSPVEVATVVLLAAVATFATTGWGFESAEVVVSVVDPACVLAGRAGAGERKKVVQVRLRLAAGRHWKVRVGGSSTAPLYLVTGTGVRFNGAERRKGGSHPRRNESRLCAEDHAVECSCQSTANRDFAEGSRLAGLNPSAHTDCPYLDPHRGQGS